MNKTIIKNNFENWLNSSNIEDHIRKDDDTFFDVLCINEDGVFSVETISGNTTFQDKTIVHKFTNGQDISNMDSTGYEDEDGNVQAEYFVEEEIEQIKRELEEYLEE